MLQACCLHEEACLLLHEEGMQREQQERQQLQHDMKCRKDANTLGRRTGHHGGLIPRHGVLVQRDAALLQDSLDPAAVDLLGLEVDQHARIIRCGCPTSADRQWKGSGRSMKGSGNAPLTLRSMSIRWLSVPPETRFCAAEPGG